MKLRLGNNIIQRFEKDNLYLFEPISGGKIRLEGPSIKEYYQIKKKLLHPIQEVSFEETPLINALISVGVIVRSDKLAPKTESFGAYNNRSSMRSSYAPFSVLWEMTNKCNLNCLYCHAELTKRKKLNYVDLPFEDLIQIADKLIDARVFEIILTGGEVLLRKNEILQLIKYLKQNSRSVGLISNGTLVDESLAQRLKALDVFVTLSLDASSEEIQRQTRGPKVFRRVIEAINILQQFSVQLNIACTLTRLNFDDLENLLRLIRSLSIQSVTIQNLIPNSDKSIYENLKLTRSQEDKLPEMIKDLKNKFYDLYLSFTEIDIFSRHFSTSESQTKYKNNLMWGCSACQRAAIIDATGTMYPCTSLKMLPLGNLLKSDIISLWNNTDNARFVRQLQCETTSKIQSCFDCKLKNNCGSGCRGEAYLLHGDWYALHDRCPMRYDPKKMRKEMIDTQTA